MTLKFWSFRRIRGRLGSLVGDRTQYSRGFELRRLEERGLAEPPDALLMPRTLRVLPCLLALPLCLLGQAVPAGPDVLTFVNGDRVSGQIIGVTSQGLIFRGVMVGDLTVEWSRIQNVHSENGFGGITGKPISAASVSPTLPPAPAPPAVQPPAPVPLAAPSPVAAAPNPGAAAPNPVAQTPPPKAALPPVTTSNTVSPSSTTSGHTWLGSRLFTGWQGSATAGFAYVGATTSLISFTPQSTSCAPGPKP